MAYVVTAYAKQLHVLIDETAVQKDWAKVAIIIADLEEREVCVETHMKIQQLDINLKS